MKWNFKPQPWMVVLGAFFAGMLAGYGSLVQIRKNSDGDGHINIIVNTGMVNVTSVNFNDNSRNVPVDTLEIEKEEA